MFKDMALSRDLVTAYRESVENRPPFPGDKGKRKASSNEDGPKATFMVLQASSWPFAPRDKDADLPPYVSNWTRTLRSREVDRCAPDVDAAQQFHRVLQEEAWQQSVELGPCPRKCLRDW